MEEECGCDPCPKFLHEGDVEWVLLRREVVGCMEMVREGGE